MIEFFKNLDKKLLKNRRSILVILSVSIFIIFFTVNPASASVGGAVATVLGWIAAVITTVVGYFLTFIIGILVNVANFNKIIDVPAVKNGWVIVRDLCNMFFVLILLIIAFGTILRQENYSAKRLLPKLIIMAVLINFSRMIFGLIIDFSQVIMATFVNGFGGDNAGNYIVNAFRIKDLGTLNDGSDIEVKGWDTAVAIILGVIALLVAFVVVVVMLAVLVMRIIMLWLYTILSPLVFLGFAFPPIQKYVGRIWEDFIKQVIIGPMLAFFLWLALTTAADNKISGLNGKKELCAGGASGGLNNLFCEGNFQKFVIVIGMFIGGLMVSQQIGGAAGSIAGKGMGSIRKGANWAKKGALLPVAGALKGGKALSGFGVDKLHEKTGVDLNAKRVWTGIKTRRAEKKQERYSAGQQKANEVMAEKGRLWGALALTGAPADAWDQITSRKGIMQRLRGGKRAARLREGTEEKLKVATAELEKLENTKKSQPSIMSDKEYKKIRKTVRDKGHEKKDLEDSIKKQEDVISNTSNDKTRNIEEKKLAELKNKHAQVIAEIKNMDQKIKGSIIGGDTEYKESMHERAGVDSEIAQKKKEIDNLKNQASKYTPVYNFEARSAEQRVVNEKAAKIKDITDGGELIRILDDAIREKDKAMVKAIAKKMAQNGDDNEFLQKYGGRSDAKGLQIFMKKLQDTAGFGEQEAFALGSEISSINKGTNHWAATNAYKMENGQWKETNAQEQNAFRSGETGKIHTQSLLRNLNRLAYGHHDEEGKFHLDEGGIKLIQKFDNAGAIKMIENGNFNESAALNIAPYIDKLREQNAISKDLQKALKERVASIEERNLDSSSQSAADVLRNIGES